LTAAEQPGCDLIVPDLWPWRQAAEGALFRGAFRVLFPKKLRDASSAENSAANPSQCKSVSCFWQEAQYNAGKGNQ
jgi:hypothetical protein